MGSREGSREIDVHDTYDLLSGAFRDSVFHWGYWGFSAA